MIDIKPLITPENIVSITFQYKPYSNVPNVSVNYPSIFVTFNDGNDRYHTIELREVERYLKMLEIQATIKGGDFKVICVESTPDGKAYSKIEVGRPSDIVPPLGYGTLTMRTPQGLHDTDFTPLINIGNIVSNNITYTNVPAIFTFTLPFTQGIFFDNDYDRFYGSTMGDSMASFGDDVLISTAKDYYGNGWRVFVLIKSTSTPPYNNLIREIKFKQPLRNITLINSSQNHANTIISRFSLSSSALESPPHYSIIPTYIYGIGYIQQSTPTDLLPHPLNVGQASIFSAYLQRYNPQYPVTFTGQLIIEWQNITQATDGEIIVYGDTIGYFPFTMQPVSGALPVNFQYDSNNYDLIIIVNFPKGETIQIADYLTLTVRLSNSIENICSQDTRIVYSPRGGDNYNILYEDVTLTQPIQGFTIVSIPNANNVDQAECYNLDTNTGRYDGNPIIVAGNTLICKPKGMKTVSVINNTGQPISINTSQGTQNFAPNMNGSIGMLAEDIVVNNSPNLPPTFGRYWFHFLKSISPDVYDTTLPTNPAFMNIGDGKPMTPDITDTNYIRVTTT